MNKFNSFFNNIIKFNVVKINNIKILNYLFFVPLLFSISFSFGMQKLKPVVSFSASSLAFGVCKKSLSRYEQAFRDKLMFKKSKGESEKLSTYNLWIKEAKEALENAQLYLFDAGVSDNACQVRASKILDIFKNKKDLVLKNLEDALNAKDGDFVLDQDAKYLVLCYYVKYFMDKHSKVDLAKLSSFKQQLIYCSVNYLQEVAKKLLQEKSIERFKEQESFMDQKGTKESFIEKILDKELDKKLFLELQEGLKQVAGNNEDAKISAPNFFGVLTLLKNDLKSGVSICLMPKVFCKECKKVYKKLFFYKPKSKMGENTLQNKFEIVSEDRLLDCEFVMVVTGNVFNGSFNQFKEFFGNESQTKGISQILIEAENTKAIVFDNISDIDVKKTCFCIEAFKKIENSDLIDDIFLPNEAQHCQFPAKFKGKEVEIDFSGLAELEQLYLDNSKKSLENGTNMKNMSLFLIDHIWADTIGSVKKKFELE